MGLYRSGRDWAGLCHGFPFISFKVDDVKQAFENGVMLNEYTSMKVINGTVEAKPRGDYQNARFYNYWNVVPKGKCEIGSFETKLY